MSFIFYSKSVRSKIINYGWDIEPYPSKMADIYRTRKLHSVFVVRGYIL